MISNDIVLDTLQRKIASLLWSLCIMMNSDEIHNAITLVLMKIYVCKSSKIFSSNFPYYSNNIMFKYV